MKIVIVGGVAGGASAAARARRLSEDAEIIVLERGPDVSFANCGLPYHIGGEIQDRSRLKVQTPESLSQQLNIDVRVRSEVISIDREAKKVRVRYLDNGDEYEESYDKLILSPGASPLRPPLPGIEDRRVHVLRTLEDMDRIKEASDEAGRVLIVGAGFIGLEVAEQLKRLGKEVTVVELVDQILPQVDPEMVRPIEDEMRREGIDLILGDGIDAFVDIDGSLEAVLKSGRKVGADLVLLSIGVKPESQLASEAGLETGQRGAIVVNSYQQTSDPDIYAAGDAAETEERILGKRIVLPLGGPANRQGRTAADHIFLGEQATPYAGSLGTAIVRVFDMAVGVTGWTEKRLKQEGIAYDTTVVTDFQHAGYYPGALPVTVKIIWDPQSGRLLGGQVYGADGADKRLDVLATAITAGMKAEDLIHLELAYAPPFGSAKDVINLAGFSAQNQRLGLMKTTRQLPEGAQVVDVRPQAMADLDPLEGATVIPAPEIRSKADGMLDRDRPVVTVCALGKTSYFAARTLAQKGYDALSLNGGMRVLSGSTVGPWSLKPGSGDENSKNKNEGETMNHVDESLDATGLACPGPLMKVKEKVDTMQPGQVLEVKASDPGFANDIAAYCRASGLPEPEVSKEKGVIRARLRLEKREGGASGAKASSADTTLVMFSQEMDKALAALVISNGAAAMGGKVTIFFTFWGLNVLRKENGAAVSGKGFMDKMFGWMLPKGMGKLPLSRMHMGGMGTAMMKWRMRSKGLPNLPGLMTEAQKNGIRLVACTMSMEAMGIKHEELIDGVELGGVADFMAASSTSGTNLFV
jgi:NADPH-dependent 2,4-dienoyl-CoA reductase/sulfur reductase-like enzyme/peroxiredoxin family protein/TusA-related sulfurtransferase/rhodanese-related sulfurtransferase